MAHLPGPPLWQQPRWGMRLRRDPLGALVALHDRYGPVFASGAGPYRFVFLVGPDAHRELFTPPMQRYSWREATKMLTVVDGETALIVSDGDDHERRRRIVQPAFNIRRIDRHVPLMIEEATKTVATVCTAGHELDAYEAFRRCIRRIVIRALFGDRLSDRADELGDRLPARPRLRRPPHAAGQAQPARDTVAPSPRG